MVKSRFAVCVALLPLLALVAADPATQPADASKERTTPSGLKIVEVSKSPDAALTKPGDTVYVHYTGRLQSTGKEFDSSLKRGEPISFQLGAGRVIRGWDEGIQGMQIGEKRQLIIPPDLGYGARGAGNDIPPNATLVFDVELVGLVRGAR
jgi:peptidylprolyl isomerase